MASALTVRARCMDNTTAHTVRHSARPPSTLSGLDHSTIPSRVSNHRRKHGLGILIMRAWTARDWSHVVAATQRRIESTTVGTALTHTKFCAVGDVPLGIDVSVVGMVGHKRRAATFAFYSDAAQTFYVRQQAIAVRHTHQAGKFRHYYDMYILPGPTLHCTPDFAKLGVSHSRAGSQRTRGAIGHVRADSQARFRTFGSASFRFGQFLDALQGSAATGAVSTSCAWICTKAVGMEKLALTTSHLVLVAGVVFTAYVGQFLDALQGSAATGAVSTSCAWICTKANGEACAHDITSGAGRRRSVYCLCGERHLHLTALLSAGKVLEVAVLGRTQGTMAGTFPGGRFKSDEHTINGSGRFVGDPVVVLPADKVHDFLSQPDNILDAYTPNQAGIAQKYTIGMDLGATIHDSNGGPHIDVVRRQLTRRLPQLTADVYEELVLAMQTEWPATADKWTTVKAYPTCMKIVSRAANRVFAGKELCGGIDENGPGSASSHRGPVSDTRCPQASEHLQESRPPGDSREDQADPKPHEGRFVRTTGMSPITDSLTLGQIALPLTLHEQRDALQWMLEDCVELAKTDPSQLDEMRLCRRLLVLNMVAIHTTSMVTTNTLLDLFSSAHAADYVSGLREEVQRVLSESGGAWSKNAINDMLRVDSTIRETMRISTLGDVGLRRQVTAPAGIDLGDDVHLPPGVTVVVPAHAIQTDAAFYGATAGEWDAFRFSRPREAHLAQVRGAAAAGDADETRRLERALEQKNQSLIAYGSDFLSFGHGRHACPGRFFASQEMKLMMAHIVMTYDVRIDGGRPPNRAINGASIPTDDAEIMIRLRSGKA
nr:ent-kaurene oxidase [Quercus suber]